MAKKPETKKQAKPSPKEQKELQEKYTKVFKKVVEAIQTEENIAIVYQVMVDILVQLEGQIKQETGSGCGQDCSSCDDCGPTDK